MKQLEDIEKKFNQIINNKTIDDLRDVMIFQETSNEFELFDKYKIIKNNKEVVVTIKNTDTKETFMNIKNAVTWCILDKRCKLMDSKRVLQLDKLLGSTEYNIKLHKQLFLRAPKNEDKFIYLAKLNEDKVKRMRIKEELYSYLTETMAWQRKKFQANLANN